MIASALRYAWWLGADSAATRKLISCTGWNISRLAYRVLGRPAGALAWPLGLCMLLANADMKNARADLSWLERCFSGLLDSSGHPLLPEIHIEHGGLGYAALRLYELGGNAKYLFFAEALGNAIVALPRAPNNLIPYTTGRPEILLDTLAFICPFLSRLARISGRADFSSLALQQLDGMWRHAGAMDGGLMHHAIDAATLQPQGLAGWGRGTAWLLLAIVDTLRELPPGHERECWSARGLALLLDLQQRQKPDGHWPWRLDDLSAASDSSVTALLAYAVARWQQGQVLQLPELDTMLERSRCALDRETDRAGRVWQCSGEAGGRGDYSENFGHYLWAQAAAVAADRICLQRDAARMPEE